MYETKIPESLENISNPPEKFYVKGQIPNARLFFAIVGTRSPTPYGAQITYKLAKELAEAKVVIVSGLARGVDTIAHKGCLAGGGKTIAVLGCGVDRVYPAENHYLYRKIIETGGAIVSEIPPGTTVKRELFAQRNRIISGLSQGVLVVEGSVRSGTLITAKFAADQGKDLFAVPGPITSGESFAPNFLIQNGAKLVMKTEDILEEYGIKIKKEKNPTIELTNEEKIIFNFLKTEPRFLDDISREKKLPINQVLRLVSSLEIKGVVEKNSENKYQIKL